MRDDGEALMHSGAGVAILIYHDPFPNFNQEACQKQKVSPFDNKAN